MRQLTNNAINSFMMDKEFSSSNTTVKLEDGSTKLYLHGNLIAIKTGKKISISNAGWATNVTKERLNGIPGVSIRQIKGIWYLNGKEWNGNFIKIN